MMVKVAGLAAIVAVSTSAAICQSLPEGGDISQPELEFSVEGATPPIDSAEPTLTTASAEEIVISGLLSTPNPCYDVTGELSADGAQLILTVTATARPEICVQVVGAFSYRARITGLPAGEYDITVSYVYPGTGWDRAEYRLSVQKP